MTADRSPNSRSTVLWASLRIVGSAAVIFTTYYIVPLDRTINLSAMALLALAVVVLVVVIFGQVMAIVRSATPGLRAIEALAVSIPLLLVSFASVHYLMSEANPQAFTEPLTRTGALYFSVTVFSTVGFGDISPVTDTTRVVVMAQMIVDLLILGIGLRIIVGAVRLAKERRPRVADPAPYGQSDTANRIGRG